MRDLTKYFKQEAEIDLHMDRIGKTADEKKTILDECWIDEEKRQNYLNLARGNLIAAEPKDDKKATADRPSRDSNVWDKEYKKHPTGYIYNMDEIY